MRRSARKRHRKRHILHHLKTPAGFVTILLLLIVVAMGLLLAGSLKHDFAPSGGGPPTANLTCCDTEDCSTVPGKTLTYNSQQYGLLKSNVKFSDGVFHLKDSGEKLDGDPIIINTSDGYQAGECGGGNGTQDQIFSSGGCYPIPNEEIVYVCKSDCDSTSPRTDHQIQFCGSPIVTCYGNENTVFDVYFRLADVNNPGVPPVIKQCAGASLTGTPQGGPTIVPPSQQPNRKNLQLQTFTFTFPSVDIPWISPYCKPAVYLYPNSLSEVNVKVNSSQPFTYTDPTYPEGGWNVLADPTGLLNYQGKYYDYLYYETKVADSDFKKPDQGYVVEENELPKLFSNILPGLGLNAHESKQFSDYWLKALPASPYYFVGIVPKETLDSVDSLNIIPSPQTQIRVTLYFQPLNQKVPAIEPTIITPVRTGFTVVEWGGIFKKDKDSKFSCLQ